MPLQVVVCVCGVEEAGYLRQGRCEHCCCGIWCVNGRSAAPLQVPAYVRAAEEEGRLQPGTAKSERGEGQGSALLQVPVYVWAAEEEGQFQPGRCSRWWLHHSLRAFEADLAALGARLIYRRAPESCVALLQLIEETGAQVRSAPPGLGFTPNTSARRPHGVVCECVSVQLLRVQRSPAVGWQRSVPGHLLWAPAGARAGAERVEAGLC